MRLAERKYFSNQKFERFERILGAAKDILGDVGPERLTIRDLAIASRVSSATLYNRFGSKDNIIALVVIDHFERAVKLVLANEDASSEPPLDRIIHMLRVLERGSIENMPLASAFMSIHFKIDGDEEIRDQLYVQAHSVMSSIITELFEDSAIKPTMPVDLIVEEATGRIFDLVFKWAQLKIPDNQLFDRMVIGIFSVLSAGSSGKGASEISTRLQEAGARLQATRNKSATKTGRPMPKPKRIEVPIRKTLREKPVTVKKLSREKA